VSEVAEAIRVKPFRGWVLYDGECHLCINLARRFERLLARHGFGTAPLQTPWVAQRLGHGPKQSLTEMRVLTADGRDWGGADGLVYLAGRIWWAAPLALVAHLPGMRALLWKIYRWVAERRHCLGGACQIQRPSGRRRATAWTPLIVLPLTALSLRSTLPAWAYMWTVAFAFYFGCKWLTWIDVLNCGARTNTWRALAYLLAWPGMDPRPFVTVTAHVQPAAAGQPRHPATTDWLRAASKLLLGIAVLAVMPRWFWPGHPLLAGWMVIVGIAIALHFGFFEMLALLWRRVGIAVEPIMDRPLYATSLRELWSTRWNRAFHELAYTYVFRPARRRLGTVGAFMLGFAISGIIHDLVISVPARGGYGLPTAYFLLQGAAILLERSRVGRRMGLGSGPRGRLFVAAVAALPVVALFHPPFVTRVMIPFAQAIGAL
jgi:alginate O-acetyltransferase complex protein AlgI